MMLHSSRRVLQAPLLPGLHADHCSHQGTSMRIQYLKDKYFQRTLQSYHLFVHSICTAKIV